MNVLILGCSGIDKFIYGEVNRVNPEAASLILNPKRIVNNPGLAANVAKHFFNLNINYNFITNPEPMTKTRFCCDKSNYILLRVDEKDRVKPVEKTQLDSINFPYYDLVLISDYNKGFLTTDHIDYITKNSKLCFIDTKKLLGSYTNNAFIKINENEYENNIKNGIKIDYEKTIITYGKNGIKYNDYLYKQENPVELGDVAGCGDTTLVFLSLYYYKTKDMSLAIKKANYYAGIAASQRGVVSKFDVDEEFN